ncbi:MAG: hypothetical protein AAFU78_22040 [Cyanobacteria bacterium J06633_2]
MTDTKSCHNETVTEFSKKQAIEQFGARATFYRYLNLAVQIHPKKKPFPRARLINVDLLELMYKLKALVEKGYPFNQIKDLVIRGKIKLDE